MERQLYLCVKHGIFMCHVFCCLLVDMQVLMQSNVPVDVLGKIWDLSDMDQDGCLDKEEFSVVSL